MLSDTEKSRLLEHVKATRRPLIVVVGATASGKTGLSLEIAELINAASSSPYGRGKRRGDQYASGAPLPSPLPLGEGNVHREHLWSGAEIINADSRQLYRHLDIGTAKIRPDEMRGIPHHLIDVLDPKEPVSIAWFQEQARRVMGEIRARGHIPVLVGGSMLYVSSIVDGLEPLPSDPELRKRLEAEAATDEGARLMHERLALIDPDAAARIHPNNKVYLVRAMELAALHEAAPSVVKKRNVSDDDLLIYGTRMDRDALKKRIADRIDAMFAAGWVNEVRSLLERGYSADDPAMESSGYREIVESLLLHSNDEDAVRSDADLRKAIVDSTMRYAKRQITWWKNDERICWIDA